MMNQDRLKAIIRNKTDGNNKLSIQLFQMFFFEHILERISKSRYKNHIILKGGLLLSSIIGEENRTTKDMDITLKGLKLSKEAVMQILDEIFSVNINDNIKYTIVSINDIRLEDDYDGYRVNVLAVMDNLKVYLQLEFTTGDVITPKEIEYKYNCIFEDKTIDIMSYNYETIIAEKFETFIRRSILNTRMKDYYDLHKLLSENIDKINKTTLLKALKNTFANRNTRYNIEYISEVYYQILNSEEVKQQWVQFQNSTPYAKEIDYELLMESIKIIIDFINLIIE